MLMEACDLAAGPQDLGLAWQLPADSSCRTGTMERIRTSSLNASVNEKYRAQFRIRKNVWCPSAMKTKHTQNLKPESEINTFHSAVAIEGKPAIGENLVFSLMFS